MRALVALIAVALVVPAAIPARADADPWPDRYELALARDPQNGFYRYAVLQSHRRAGNQEAPPWASTDRTRWQRQLYEMTTGAWSVQEALQTDRLLGDGDGNAAHMIPIGSIKSVPAATIPFLAWSAEGYIKSISFSMTRFAYVEQSIGVILFGSGGLLSRLPMLVGCGFVYLLAWRGVLGRYTSSMLSMLAFGLLTPVFFVQYMIWIIALILLTPCDMFMRQPTLQADV